MNTQETNNSAWSTKYYAAVAAPLTVVSVLLPLVALKLLEAFNHLRSMTALREALIWGVITLSSLVQFGADIRYLASADPPGTALWAATFIFGFILPLSLTFPYMAGLFATIREDMRRSGENDPDLIRVIKATVSRCSYWRFFFFFGTLAYVFLGVLSLPLTEFIPHVIYIFIRAKYFDKASRGTTNL